MVEPAGPEAYAGEVRRGRALGLAWGLVLRVVGGTLVVPLWLSAVGFAGASPFPTLGPQSIPGHTSTGSC